MNVLKCTFLDLAWFCLSAALAAVVMILFPTWGAVAYAASFSVNETVFVAFPQGNIKDDAFIVGKITKIHENGDFQVSVLDYVEGHDYGSSCIPISKNTTDEGLGAGWEIWQDTTRLETQRLEYVVPHKAVMKLDEGKHYFVERNNIYIVFGRWKSDAPMLSVERLERAKREAESAGLSDILPALALAQKHRRGFYGDFGRPLSPPESISPLVEALETVLALFSEDAVLEQLWRAKHRDWKTIGLSTRYYFLIQAIDKVVRDAKDQRYEEGVEQAGEEALNRLDQHLQLLQRTL
jgi:hypothetical protein